MSSVMMEIFWSWPHAIHLHWLRSPGVSGLIFKKNHISCLFYGSPSVLMNIFCWMASHDDIGKIGYRAVDEMIDHLNQQSCVVPLRILWVMRGVFCIFYFFITLFWQSIQFFYAKWTAMNIYIYNYVKGVFRERYHDMISCHPLRLG